MHHTRELVAWQGPQLRASSGPSLWQSVCSCRRSWTRNSAWLWWRDSGWDACPFFCSQASLAAATGAGLAAVEVEVEGMAAKGVTAVQQLTAEWEASW